MIVDAHEDIAFNAIVLGRDFLLPTRVNRAREVHPDPLWGTLTVGFPEMQYANVRLVFASIWAAPCNNPSIPVKQCYRTAQEACNLAEQQLSYYRSLIARDHRISLVRTKQGLDRVIGNDYRLGLILSMEGADPIITPHHLHEWMTEGVRVLSLAYRRTRYAGATGEPGPLTQLGRELLYQMGREHLILDTSHLAEVSFFEALDLFEGHVIATHSNCRAIVPTDRHLSDGMIRAIVERDGVIGIALYNSFLSSDWWKTGKRKDQVTLSHFVRQVEHICDLVGDSLHVGIGSDLDGAFGSESIPAELETIADLPRIGDALTNAGFSEDDVNGILGKNWLRFLKKALPG